MSINKLIKKNGEYIIYCDRIDEFINALDCKNCKGFRKIDPVTATIKCRGDS